MAERSPLERLPPELLQDIVELLDKDDLGRLNLAARWCYEAATPLIWRDLVLTDCSTFHEQYQALDEHDDTPLIKKLVVLVQKPWIARQVQIVSHRCHLPPPGIFHELAHTPLTSKTLSTDERTQRLVYLAVQHMTNVHTLRIIFGHPPINDALLRSFFDQHRNKNTAIRRLWLENCHIGGACFPKAPPHDLELPRHLEFHGLESVRFRRLPMRPSPEPLNGTVGFWNHARSYTQGREMQDGAGGYYMGSANSITTEFYAEELDTYAAINDLNEDGTLEDVHLPAAAWDELIWNNMAQTTELPRQLISHFIADDHETLEVEPPRDSAQVIPTFPDWVEDLEEDGLSPKAIVTALLMSTKETLTSLCFDWVLTKPHMHFSISESERTCEWLELYLWLFDLRFPRLKALQFRNNVVRDTAQPKGLYLLDRAQTGLQKCSPSCGDGCHNVELREAIDYACLEFMEAHANLQCLAWPMDAFFSEKQRSPELERRVEAVVDSLGRTLVDLRIDTQFRSHGEPFSDSSDCPDIPTRQRRRRFIEEFATRMTKVESIKMEGGVPRDERREIIRALHACPLQKIVMIGVSCPIGNTWGEGGRDLGELIPGVEIENLEGEDKDSTHTLGSKAPTNSDSAFRFEPTYGWPPDQPMIHTIASFHRSTVTELKFCGYQGSPILFTPTPITNPLLAGLKYFHNLRSLVLSTWLSTMFEGSPQDADIIRYWLSTRDPRSTSLVHVTDEEPEGWEKELKTKFAPNALAWQVTNFIGPFLSEEAKARKGGVHVRASVCIGEAGGIFDIDLHVGQGGLSKNVCLGYKGPREELEPERRRSKLENRRWF